jgi:colicin import membrane protein
MTAAQALRRAPRDPARMLAGVLALGVHAGFVLLLVFGVSWQTEHPAPVMAELWPALPPSPAARPVPPDPAPAKPAPRAKPAADDPGPKAPDIALEKKRREVERLERQQAAEAAREAARAEADALRQARDRQQAEQKQRELLRRLEAEELSQRMADESAALAARQAQQAEAQAAGKRQAERARVVGQYRDMISAKVRGNTRLPDALKGNPKVHCLVKLLPTGEVVSVRVTQSSGNPAYDEAVLRAIQKSSPLPLPAEREARAAFVPELLFVHRPRE